MRAGRPAWLDEQVEVTETGMDLPMRHPVEVDRPYRQLDDGRQVLDEHALAELIAQALA